MRVLDVCAEPFHVLPYAVGPGVGAASASLPFHWATVDELPEWIDVVVATGDLQGFASSGGLGGPPRPLGEALVGELDVLRAAGRLPDVGRTAVVLAGDLYPRADAGDVCGVWRSVRAACRWVVGVAGNHDSFGSGGGGTTAAAARAATAAAGMYFLDGDAVRVDGLRIAGLSGVVGRQGGVWTRGEGEFAAAVARLAEAGPDLIVLHDGPNLRDLAGWPSVRRALEAAPPTLAIRGHDAWPSPLGTLENGTQVLNVEGKVVVLRRG
jgi:3',5'-cyclic-AMP phosphodiesterase